MIPCGIHLADNKLNTYYSYICTIYNGVKRGKQLMLCPKVQFLAKIRNANVFMKFIGSRTTCIVLWDIA